MVNPIYSMEISISNIELSSQFNHSLEAVAEPSHRRSGMTERDRQMPRHDEVYDYEDVYGNERRANQGRRTNHRRSASSSRIDPRTYKPSSFPAGLAISPHVNPHRIFELKTYDFPADKQIQTKSSDRALEILSNKTKIVVVEETSNEAFATLDKTRHLRPIYECNSEDKRMKINIITGLVSEMTLQEIKECPVDCPIREEDFVIINAHQHASRH
ncbi:uncharacterized protein LOC117179542 [Belonocnema kinseyi]|uniref:uncharacterized protein LOC117179542 n=1 Tax=Belonocnema kinseyi TaxID=2817044 RepID=UPI00143DBB9E|nr:uncharacterized protein LOC117179542 [Belonocnema kinseyi]